VFVEHEVVLERPAAEVSAALMGRLSEVEGLGSAAYRHGEHLRSRVGPIAPIAKEVLVAVGRPQMSRSGLVLPVTWRATGAQSLFPRLDGELVVLDHGAHRCMLRLQASYRPPFGWIGDVVDRFLLARFARLTVEDWLRRLATSMVDGPPPSGVSTPHECVDEI
jgi:hypothetical protein